MLRPAKKFYFISTPARSLKATWHIKLGIYTAFLQERKGSVFFFLKKKKRWVEGDIYSLDFLPPK